MFAIGEDPVYLCVLPDSDHETCSVDESNAVDTTDTADTCVVDSTETKFKKKFLRKEDSGTYNMPHYDMHV